jgi:hypothetical protein
MSIEDLSDKNKCIVLSHEKGYSFSDGKIISPYGKCLKLMESDWGYLMFSFRLSKNHSDKPRTHTVMVHRLVAYQKFGMKMFESNTLVRHLDGNCKNNNPENIAIGSPSDNMFDQPKEVRLRKAITATTKNRKFSDEDVRLIKADSKIHKIPYSQIMKKWDITSKGTLSFIINNEYKSKKS